MKNNIVEALSEIVLVPLGGLCNRLRAVMSAISLARDSLVPLRVVWLRDSGLNARFSDLFQPLPPIPGAAVEIMESAAWYAYGVPRLRNLYIPSLYQRKAYDTILSEARLAAIIHDASSMELASSIQHHLRGKVLIQTGLGFYPTDDREFLQLFAPSEAVRSLLTKRQSNIGPHTVGLHIRRTDNVMALRHSPLSAFEAAMRSDLERDPEASFYIATDDPDVQTELSSRFPSCCWSKISPSRSTLVGMQDALAELFTLIACPRFHGSYWSSFSDMVVACHNPGEADIIYTEA